MFVRMKKSGNREYLQIVRNRRVGKKVQQQVLLTLGRLDELKAKGEVETLAQSLMRFCEKLIVLGKVDSQLRAHAVKIGPVLIFERLWKELGIPEVLETLLKNREYEFDVERAVFVTVLHRLMTSGSDRWCNSWREHYKIGGTEELSLHHFYRAMAFLGEEVETPESEQEPGLRRTKDKIEEMLFERHRDLFSSFDMMFFDTTSIYFEGHGGEYFGEYGYSKDHRPDLLQMVVGIVVDSGGRPLCSEMLPGNTADITTLVPVLKRIQGRFGGVKDFCIVADRGMLKQKWIDYLESPENSLEYIIGVRMRNLTEVRERVLSDSGPFQVVHPESEDKRGPSPLQVKEVTVNGVRYIVCFNPRQARKDAQDRAAIVQSLEEQLKRGAKSLVGNKGYRRYLSVESESVTINKDKIAEEERYDGKWVLRTNTKLPAAEVALKYKELWQVERIFRSMKSLLDTRPIFHQRDDTIAGHVFCSFLALLLMKELERRLELISCDAEWNIIKNDLGQLQEVSMEIDGKPFVFRTESEGVCGKVFQAVGVALPPSVRPTAS